ncbi:YrbL family protein [uncultured Bartonella sp.]|uniref:YrbL family protein n=1 Tax=uncultured Bartonella sp. TaxID=104108 RepID=UPI00262FC972|nr:YrbL family protein [uncultured Bartonella sp.]
MLKDKTPMFDNGRHRVIFQHPQNAGLIIKIVRPQWAERQARYSALKKHFKPSRENVFNICEFLETMRVNSDTNFRTPHILTTLGIVRTDLGWGMVCEIEKDKDGTPAKTLKNLGNDIKNYIDELKDLSVWAQQSPVVLTSFHMAISSFPGATTIMNLL